MKIEYIAIKENDGTILAKTNLRINGYAVIENAHTNEEKVSLFKTLSTAKAYYRKVTLK